MRSRTSSARLTGVSNLAVTAPIKPGFVAGFDTITYVERLNRLLTALNVARVATRESSLIKPAFPDSIGRFEIIRSFRYAVIPPQGEGPRDPPLGRKLPGVSRLSLNVTFDAGWEPYMRVIYRDVGTLLDALFCHCDGYPGSRASSFDDYCAWVRDNELDGGLYYLDSPLTLGDQEYLDRLEKLQRTERCPVTADRAIAELAVPPAHKQRALALAEARANPAPSFFASMRALKGFFRLSTYFPPNTGDGEVLIRFARAVLGEFYELHKHGVYGADPLLRGLLGDVFRDEIHWFDTKIDQATEAKAPAFERGKVQAGIVDGYKKTTHGCVVLLRVATDASNEAVAFLKKYPVSRQGTPGKGGIERNVAFTFKGMEALGIAPDRLDKLPQEFFEGMEKRASLLGDVRTNHPENWARPVRNWPPAKPNSPPASDRIDLSTVHVVIQLRTVDPKMPGPDVLHPRLRKEIEALDVPPSGLKVLGFQPGWSQRETDTTSREHFGFIDGASQPLVEGDVAPGEIVLGYPNDRDGPQPPQHVDPLLKDGSFLVLRKLQQNVGLLNRVVPDRSQQEKLMGRGKDGEALVKADPPGSNNFNYVADPSGLSCPFHSHVRRANPRDGRPYTPRIMRRGMSYGPCWSGPDDTVAERGIVFMAYCASIAEQFEVVQRWMAGGNSSGVSSSQADPFLGVPEPGEQRVFRFPQGDGVVRIDLGDKPFIALQWGLYLFAPSVDALKKLATYRTPNQATPAPATATPPPTSLWKLLLEDSSWDPSDPTRQRQRNAVAWQGVRAEPGGVLATDYGLLVGSKKGVLAVLRDDGSRFSVKGYGARMGKSIGDGFLGMDKAEHDLQAEHGVNQAIASFDQAKVFGQARGLVDAFMVQMTRLAALESLAPLKVPLDLVSMSEIVLAQLCAAWFGLPDKVRMIPGGRSADKLPVRCPGHLLTVSRYIFGPRPNAYVEKEAEEQGQEVLTAFQQVLRNGRLGPLAEAIKSGLQHLPEVQNGDPRSIVAKTLAGAMLGFPPTVQGNFLRTMETLIRSERLWSLQQKLLEKRRETPDVFKRASSVLFDPLIETMRKRPLPEMIWRTAAEGATVEGVAPTDPDQRVVVGLASALSDPKVDHSLMFGGTRKAGPYQTLHACPGYDMAIGVLLALLSGLLEAGELRPTGSSVSLTLAPR